METLIDFAERIGAQTACYFHVSKSGNVVSLKKFDTTNKKRMGCIGWISELKYKDKFCFAASKDKAIKAGVKTNFDGEQENIIYGETGVIILIDRGSDKSDFEKLILAVKALMENFIEKGGTELEIDLRISKGIEKASVVVASDKLTDENWISFGPGELKVWKDGALVETNTNLRANLYQVRPDSIRLWNRIVSRLNAQKTGWRQTVENFGQVRAVKDRRAGKSWSDDEIFEGLLRSVLSNNTDWARIETVLPELSNVFNGFSLESYANLPKEEVKSRIVPWFEKRRAGSSTLKRSLEYLINASQILLEWSGKYGSAENYFLGLMEHVQGDPKRAAIKMGSYASQYKLPAFGVALAAEALRNIGFDLAKPDRHILRSVGSFGLMEFSKWTDRSGTKPPAPTTQELFECMAIIEKLAMSAGEYTSLVDNAIWMTCARSGLHLSNDALKEMAGGQGMASIFLEN